MSVFTVTIFFLSFSIRALKWNQISCLLTYTFLFSLFSPQCLPYSLLLQQLDLKNVRELEDLLIEAVYCDIIQGKLDQRNQQVEVDCSVGRDLGPNELPNIINTLQEWSVSPLSVCGHTLDLCLNYLFFLLRAFVLSQVCRL